MGFPMGKILSDSCIQDFTSFMVMYPPGCFLMDHYHILEIESTRSALGIHSDCVMEANQNIMAILTRMHQPHPFRFDTKDSVPLDL